MSQSLTHNEALIYAIGLNDLNIALDLVEEKIEHTTNNPVLLGNLHKQVEALQKAIAQWDDRFVFHVSDKIRIQ